MREQERHIRQIHLWGSKICQLVQFRQTFCAQLKDSPATVTMPDSADLLEAKIVLQRCGTALDLRVTLVLGIPTKEGHGIELALQGIFRDDFSVEAVEEDLMSTMHSHIDISGG